MAHNVVCTSQPLATHAGVEALREGGNAVDAALAAAITLAVVEPCSNGLGSDAFASIWIENELMGINGSGRSPRAWTRERFNGLTRMPELGWDSVTVPGAISTWVEMSRRYGKLPFERLFTRSIEYARNGFLVGPTTAKVWAGSVNRFRGCPSWWKYFLPNGVPPSPGQLFQSKDLAHTLELIARSDGQDFYAGELAQKIIAQSNREDGVIALADLENHDVEFVHPLSQRYGEVELHELPPNGQGLAVLIALAILEHLDTRSMKPNSVDWLHFQIEAMKVAISASFRHFSDPNSMRTTPEALLDPVSIRRAANDISKNASEGFQIPFPTAQDTVYLAAADAQGIMVSMIQSNYMGFGSGIVVDGTGISLQNRGAGFVLTHNHPNEVGGGKRPFHTIIPGFVTKHKKPLMAFGVMGGYMQPQGHVQIMTRIFDHQENPQAASDAPRWYVSPTGEVILEKGYSQDVVHELASRGHSVSISGNVNFFGGAQLIYRLSGGYCGASDHRKEGLALGF